MARGVRMISQTIRALWHAVTGGKRVAPATHPRTGVILHDPAAQRPHDLDDPFFDPAVQARAAELIARAARKK
jgi:hypothetical protein